MLGCLHWTNDSRLHINFLWADDARVVARMFAAFRRLHPDSDVFFEASPGNIPMMRFVDLVGAVPTDDGYCANTGAMLNRHQKEKDT